jgi:hypothetical protein
VNSIDLLGMWFDFLDPESREMFESELWPCASNCGNTEFFILLSELRDSDKRITPFLPISDPFNGALKRPTQKANS